MYNYSVGNAYSKTELSTYPHFSTAVAHRVIPSFPYRNGILNILKKKHFITLVHNYPHCPQPITTNIIFLFFLSKRNKELYKIFIEMRGIVENKSVGDVGGWWSEEEKWNIF